MGLKIDLDHPTIASGSKIQQLTAAFLEKNGFNYFQFLRCYADGSIGLLTNNTSLLEGFVHVNNSPVVFSSYDETHQDMASYWFLWDESLPAMPVQFAKDQCNFHNGITLVRRSKQYYDMLAVATPAESGNSDSFYLNKLKIIESFFHEFEYSHPEMIQLMNKNPIFLPESYRDENYSQLCLAEGILQIPGKAEQAYITTQELTCLRLLQHRMTYKEIAKMTGLSPRTVETYLQRIKVRTELSLDELMTMLQL